MSNDTVKYKKKNYKKNNYRNDNSNIRVEYVREYSSVSVTLSHTNFSIKNKNQHKNQIKNQNKNYNTKNKNFSKNNNNYNNSSNRTNKFNINYKQQENFMTIKNSKNHDSIFMNKGPFNYFGDSLIKPVFQYLFQYFLLSYNLLFAFHHNFDLIFHLPQLLLLQTLLIIYLD